MSSTCVKFIVSALREAPREVEAVVEVVDDDDATRAHQPRHFCREQADRSAPNTIDRLPSWMSPISAAW